MSTVDLFSPAAVADPFPLYRRLRDEAPVYWDEDRSVWIVSTYDDVVALMKSPAISLAPLHLPPRFRALFGRSLVQTDPPEHTWLRGLVSKRFTRARVNEMAPRIQEIVDGLLPDHGPFDLVTSLASPLPITVIAEILGVPHDDQATFREWSEDFLRRSLAYSVPAPGKQPVPMGTTPMELYFRRAIEERRRAPRDDLISELIAAADSDAGKLSTADILAFCQTLLVGGNETTTNFLANAMAALLASPEQYAAVVADPSRLPKLIDEVLRFDTPLPIAAIRVTKREIPVRDRTIPAGARVLLCLGAANHDESRFERPDEFWIDRPENDHIAFGFGPHYCLGAPLARLEAQIALSSLFRRFPRLIAARDGTAVRSGNGMVRGFSSLPLDTVAA